MDLSKIKMVVSDMDGTLLNSDHQVSDHFFNLFEELKKKNIQFVAASGRQYNSIIDKLKPIKDDIIVIAENGGYVMRKNTELLSTPLSKKHQKDVLGILNTVEDLYPVLCGKQNAYINGKSEAFVAKLREYYTEFEILDELENHTGEILKIAIYHFESSEAHIYPKVKHLENELKVKVSGENWLDISSPNAHKGYALQKLMDLYNIASDEIMVFGDYNNDLEMLALADVSVAMANAHSNVKAISNFETTSNDDLGVERFLEKLVSGQTN
ncbi:HAD family hydrolase [Maribacter sp. X9]|uniref:HAD family hydrolase n=1 Tax=Maribacter sp. X9 TaxID=3402159 RepID=UPI003AF3DC43